MAYIVRDAKTKMSHIILQDNELPLFHNGVVLEIKRQVNATYDVDTVIRDLQLFKQLGRITQEAIADTIKAEQQRQEENKAAEDYIRELENQNTISPSSPSEGSESNTLSDDETPPKKETIN